MHKARPVCAKLRPANPNHAASSWAGHGLSCLQTAYTDRVNRGCKRWYLRHSDSISLKYRRKTGAGEGIRTLDPNLGNVLSEDTPNAVDVSGRRISASGAVRSSNPFALCVEEERFSVGSRRICLKSKVDDLLDRGNDQAISSDDRPIADLLLLAGHERLSLQIVGEKAFL